MSRPDDIVNYGTGARLRAVLISLASVVVLVGIVVGVPTLLARIIGNPLPDGVPSWAVIRAHLEAGTIPAPAIVSVLAVLAWVLWLSISLPILIELASAVRGVATPRLAVSFPGSRLLARRLVAGVFVVSTSVSSIAAAAPALAAVAVAPQDLNVDVLATDITDTSLVAASSLSDDEESAAGLQRYEVGSGETLRSIAHDTLGDANRWKEVRMASVGVVQPDGTRLPEDVIRVVAGTILHLPPDAMHPAGDRLARSGGEVALPMQAPATASRTITVAKGNHFWGLAERTLADEWGRSPTDAEIAPYWRELVEKNAHQLVKAGDPNLILPDQRLLLPPVPADGQVAATPEDVDLEALEAVLTVLPDAEAQSGEAQPDYEMPQTTPDGSATRAHDPVGDHGESDSPNNSGGGHPLSGASGQPMATDADAGEETVGTALHPLSPQSTELSGHESAPIDPLSTERAARPNGPSATADESLDLSRWVVAGLGVGLMTAALAQALARRRRRQWQARTEGRMPAPLSTEALVLESSLRNSAEFERLKSTEAALRSLSPLLPADAPGITAIAVSANDIVLTLDRFCEPPGLFSSAEDSPLWQLRTDDEATQVALAAGAGNVAVLPALVTLGHDPSTSRDILVDLEHVLALDVVGSEPSAAQFVRTLAAELAASPFAEDVDVICCGFGHELCGFRRVVLVDSVDEACAEARRRQASTDDSDGPDESPLARRLRKPGDGQTPVVLLAAQLVDDSERAKLSELSLHGVVVVAPGIDAKWSVALLPGGLRVEPLGLKLVRHDFTDDQFAALGELIEASDMTTPEVVPDALTSSAVTTIAADVTATAATDFDRASASGGAMIDGSQVDAGVGSEPSSAHLCDIEVQVLGTVDVVGADRDFSSARAIDVISYLVFHRDGANADMLKTWIWPIDEPPSDKAFANVMSRARKGLGVDDDGQPYLARADSHGNYRLLDSVRSDVDRFEQLLTQAQHEINADRIESSLDMYRRALELVRGVPFTGGGAKGFLWADNGVRAQIEFSIDEAAHKCADLALESGDLETARAAAFRGLNVIPWCEGCYRRRFRVAAASGNRTELKSAMADLEAVLGADANEPEGSDQVSDETLALYSELLRAQPGNLSAGIDSAGIDSAASQVTSSR